MPHNHPASEKCIRCCRRKAVRKVRERLVLASSREEIDAKKDCTLAKLLWVSGPDAVSPLCRACLQEEEHNLQYLKSLIAAGSIDQGSVLISILTSGCPVQPQCFRRLRAKYDPELVTAEVEYAAATCYKLWKLHIARQLYRDNFPRKRDSNNPLANFAIFSFVALAHAMLDSMACWLRERLSIQAPWPRTGLFPRRHGSFRKAVAAKNPEVGKVLAKADVWLSELDTRRNTLVHRTVLLPIYHDQEDCQKLPVNPAVGLYRGGPGGIAVTDYLDCVLRNVTQLADDITDRVQ